VIHLFRQTLTLSLAFYLDDGRCIIKWITVYLTWRSSVGRVANARMLLFPRFYSHTLTLMGQFESDATACFDREIMKFVLACYHSTGAPMGPLQMWESVLYNIVYRVKTVFGLSKGGYNFSPGSPIYGPGQGSKGGSSFCSTMASILIDGMPRLWNVLQFTDPHQQLQYSSTVNMFVDDASNCMNHFLEWLHEPPSLEDPVEMI
jgi:hypothetical protein